MKTINEFLGNLKEGNYQNTNNVKEGFNKSKISNYKNSIFTNNKSNPKTTDRIRNILSKRKQ